MRRSLPNSMRSSKSIRVPTSVTKIPKPTSQKLRHTCARPSRSMHRNRCALPISSPPILSEPRSRPVELLEILGQRVEMQQTLLGEEERQLFEDFLLQEIAEAIRTHILEAEEWVQQINRVLSNLPMIGEHYALQWKAPVEYDMTKLGTHLPHPYPFLLKPPQPL